MDDSEGSAIENAASSPEKTKKSPSRPARGTNKRGRGRSKRVQKSSSDNEATQNGGLQVACLKHVGKFRYLSNLTQAESVESEANQLETVKTNSTRGKRGRGRGRGRGVTVQIASPSANITEPSNHVSSRGRRIKPNSRWASEDDYLSSPPKPTRGSSRRSSGRSAKRIVDADAALIADAAADVPDIESEKNLTKLSSPSNESEDEGVGNFSKEDVASKPNGNIEHSGEVCTIETESQPEDQPVDASGMTVVEDVEVESEVVCEDVEIAQVEEAAIVLEVETGEVKNEEDPQSSSAEEDLAPVSLSESLLVENEPTVSEVTSESNDEVFDTRYNEAVVTDASVSPRATADLSVTDECKASTSPTDNAVSCSTSKENVITEKECSNASNSEAVELIPEYMMSSASNTPKHDEDFDSQSILLSPKPVKVKSRWRRTSELEQVICRTKTETNSNESTPNVNLEAPTASLPDSSNKTYDTSDVFTSMDDRAVVEERLKAFEIVEENLYLTNKKTSKEVKRMLCDCTLTKEEIARGELGCGEDCINRLLMIECGSRCQLGERCTNKRFQKRQYAKLEVFNAGKKGVGLRALQDLSPGDFIIEYVGEVIDPREFNKRAKEYARDKNKHYYFMALKSDAIIDATGMGNVSRFINHSCDPNAETQKWTVNGDLRVGFFVRKLVKSGEELTFDYQFQRYGKEAQRCFCDSENCRGWIGEDPDKEEKGREKREKKDKRRRSILRDEVNTIDLESEIDKLANSGVKNRAQTLNLSRLMVRAEDIENRRSILSILRNAEQPCRRLFLDYHGLKLLWGWMVDASSAGSSCENFQLKLDLLSILASLPIPNKTMVLDSKVLPIVEKWAAATDTVNEEEKPESTEAEVCMDKIRDQSQQVVSLSAQLLESWLTLKEVFRIPKKERIEEMKEHEREADRERNDNSLETVDEQAVKTSSYDRRPSNYLPKDREKLKRTRESPDREARKNLRIENDSLSKEERRRLFALKVAQQEEELRARRNQEDVWRRHLEQCLSLTLETAVPPGSFEVTPIVAPASPNCQASLPQVFWDPVMNRWQPCPEENVVPFISNPAMTPLSETSSTAHPKIPTEPPLLHLVIPKGYDPTSMGPLLMDFDASEYEATGIPYVPACLVVQQPDEEIVRDEKADELVQSEKPASNLPRFWRQAVDERGRIYYYHVKIRLPQWEPPTPDGQTPDFSSEEEVEEEEEMPQPESSTATEQTSVEISENPKETERVNRKNLLCKEKIISPRSDFERSDDAQRYRELKERLLRCKLTRIRERGLWVDDTKVEHKSKHKERDRRRLSEKEKEKLKKRAKEKYKRSLHKAENRKRMKEQQPVETSNFVDPVSEPAPAEGNDSFSEKDLADASIYDDTLNLGDGEDEAAEQERNKDVSANTVRKIKDAFRMKISSDIVNILNPYRRPDCKSGRITCTDDFKHLARKMTHFVLAKELKHCRNIEDLVVNDSVKHKARDFIKKYMMKFGPAYKRGTDDDA